MPVRAAAEIALGLVYLAGAAFNLVYARTHGRAFFGEFATGAWVSPYRALIRDFVLPNAAFFAVLLAAFEVTVAAMLLSRSALVAPGLAVGLLFTLAVIPASRGPGLGVNVALAVAQVALLQQRLADA